MIASAHFLPAVKPGLVGLLVHPDRALFTIGGLQPPDNHR
jgi:hypothetical protein